MTKNANLGPKIPIWGQKGQYLAKNAYSRPNLAFKAKILVFWGWSQSFWYQNFWYPRSHIREPMRQVLKTLTGNRPLRTKICNVDPKIWIFGAKSQFLFCNRDFCQQSISQLYQGLQLSHSDHPKKISVSEIGFIFGAHPCFWQFWAIFTFKV